MRQSSQTRPGVLSASSRVMASAGGAGRRIRGSFMVSLAHKSRRSSGARPRNVTTLRVEDAGHEDDGTERHEDCIKGDDTLDIRRSSSMRLLPAQHIEPLAGVNQILKLDAKRPVRMFPWAKGKRVAIYPKVDLAGHRRTFLR